MLNAEKREESITWVGELVRSITGVSTVGGGHHDHVESLPLKISEMTTLLSGLPLTFLIEAITLFAMLTCFLASLRC